MHISVIYVRVVLVSFQTLFKGTGCFEALPTGVGRTLVKGSYVVNSFLEDKIAAFLDQAHTYVHHVFWSPQNLSARVPAPETVNYIRMILMLYNQLNKFSTFLNVALWSDSIEGHGFSKNES